MLSDESTVPQEPTHRIAIRVAIEHQECGSDRADGGLGCIEHSSTSPATAVAPERMGVSEASSTVRGGVPVKVWPRAAELRRRRRDTPPLQRGYQDPIAVRTRHDAHSRPRTVAEKVPLRHPPDGGLENLSSQESGSAGADGCLGGVEHCPRRCAREGLAACGRVAQTPERYPSAPARLPRSGAAAEIRRGCRDQARLRRLRLNAACTSDPHAPRRASTGLAAGHPRTPLRPRRAVASRAALQLSEMRPRLLSEMPSRLPSEMPSHLPRPHSRPLREPTARAWPWPAACDEPTRQREARL